MPEPVPAPLVVTRHAMDRYRERVADLPDREIFAALSTPAIVLAAEFGAPFVRLPSGHRAVVKLGSVVTILPADCNPCCLDPRRDFRKPAS